MYLNILKHSLKEKKNLSIFLRNYGEITKYGLRPLAGLQLGLRVFAEYKSCFLVPKKNHSVEYGRDNTKPGLQPLAAKR